MDGGRLLDTGVAKGSLSKESAVVGRVAVVSAVLGRRARPSRRGVGAGMLVGRMPDNVNILSLWLVINALIIVDKGGVVTCNIRKMRTYLYTT
jgi:hypothetical protein